MRRIIISIIITSWLSVLTSASPAAPPPLFSWTDNSHRQTILSFIQNAVKTKPVAERVAVFDVDGTLIVEKPQSMLMYLDIEHLCEKKERNPYIYKEPVYQMACSKNYSWLDQHMNTVQLTAFYNETQSAFNKASSEFVKKPENPVYHAPIDKLFYQPMAELIIYLIENQFMVYLVSGSQQGFIRGLVASASAEGFPNIPDRQVLSQSVLLRFNASSGAFVRTYEVRLPEVWNEGKAEAIRMDLGRIKPILAFGNTMGDFEMLEYTDRPGEQDGGLSLILNHDDASRECFYEDKELLDKAKLNDWIVVSMKEDFKNLFQSGVTRKKADCKDKKK